MNRILLVGVYPPAIASLKERVERLVQCPMDWTAEQTAPEAQARLRSGAMFDIVVVDEATPGLAPSAERLVREIRQTEPVPRLIAVGHDTTACKYLVLAGCENWCSIVDLPDLLRGFVIGGVCVT